MFCLSALEASLLGPVLRSQMCTPGYIGKTLLLYAYFLRRVLNISTASQGNKRAGASLPKNRKNSFLRFGGKEKGDDKGLTPRWCHLNPLHTAGVFLLLLSGALGMTHPGTFRSTV